MNNHNELLAGAEEALANLAAANLKVEECIRRLNRPSDQKLADEVKGALAALNLATTQSRDLLESRERDYSNACRAACAAGLLVEVSGDDMEKQSVKLAKGEWKARVTRRMEIA